MKGPIGDISKVCFSNDGKKILCISSENSIYIWKTEIGEQGIKLPIKNSMDPIAIFSPDGKKIAVGSSDALINIWNAETGEQIDINLKGYNGVSSICFSPDSNNICVGYLF